MKKFDAEIVGIHQVNSIDFVKSAFQVYNSGNVLAILKQSNSSLTLKQEIMPKTGGGWLDVKQDVIQDDRLAQIVFTSGTEGAPKAILLSHRALADVVTRLNQVMQVDNSIREYVGIPVTYSFGFGRCRAVAAAGGKCYIPENGFNPGEIARMLESNEINAISAVPTLWRTLLVQPEIIGELGRKVRWIEIGSQYMSRQEKEKMKTLFPNAIIVQHYGLTEASRTTFLEIHETEGDLLESVGQPYGDVEVKLSPEGLIMIRGPHVTSGRLIDDEIQNLVDAEGWYTTGDYGQMQGKYLYYGGRADDLINCGGVKVNPDPLQEKVNRRLKLDNKIAVCRIKDELRGDGFFVAIAPGVDAETKQILEIVHEELLALGVNARSSIKLQEVDSIPRTDTGKVKRRELSELYTHVASEPAIANKSGKFHSIYDLYSQIFPGVELNPGDTFRGLGGDSLTYVQMVVMLEDYLGHAPVNWDNMTIEDLGKIQKRKKSKIYSWIDTSIFLRAIAISGVVATHSGGSLLGGGTLLLFALIGYNMARFKAVDFLSGKVWKWMFTYVIVILIPYYFVLAIYQGWGRTLEFDEIFLYSNLVARKITIVFPFWFVQVLLQCLILFGVIFSFKSLRRHATNNPFGFSLIVLLCLIAVREIYPLIWHTDYLNNLVPPRFLAILWLGWSFFFASTLQQRILLAAVGIGFTYLDTGLYLESIWLLLASIFLPFIPRIPVPIFTKRIINDVGAATFYIFSFNGLIISLLAHLITIESKLVIFMITMSVSMIIWWIMEKMQLIARVQSAINMKVKNEA